MKLLLTSVCLFIVASIVYAQNPGLNMNNPESQTGETIYLIRDVLHAKPGKAKYLVKKFKEAAPYFEKQGLKNVRVMTDIAAPYWTVVIESQVNDLGSFAKNIRGETSQPEVREIMKGYMDLVDGGYREIFLIE